MLGSLGRFDVRNGLQEPRARIIPMHAQDGPWCISIYSATDSDLSLLFAQPMPKKLHKPTINYHLARLGKKIQ